MRPQQEQSTSPACADASRTGIVRDLIASQHRDLRATIAALQARCEEVETTGSIPMRALRSGLRQLVYALHAHLAFEEAALGPLLQEADAWGTVRREAMLHEHERQRAVMRDLLKTSERRQDPASFLRRLRQFCSDLLADMNQEERGIFSPAV